jgi:dihydroflavonol-4-reductase
MTFLLGKKILVTGGTGHLGSALVHHLVQNLKVDPANIRIFYLANTPTQSVRDVHGLDLFPGNILRFEDVKRAAEGVEYIFHVAGSTSFDPRQKRLQWFINVEGTRNVLDVFRQSASIQKMCYTSTVNTLGVPNPVGSIGNFENSDPYKNEPRLHSFRSAEETLTFVDRVHRRQLSNWEKRIGIGYFDSKLAAQELVQHYGRKFGLNVVSVLPGTLFGPYDFLIGNGIYLLSIYRRQMPGVLKGGISAVHVMDVVEGQILSLEKGQKGARYIITGAKKDNLYLKDMAKIIAEVLRQQFPDKKIRIPSIVFPHWMANTVALFSELYAKLFHQPCLLSRAAVKAGSMPLFYTYEKAAQNLEYQPKRTFRQAVEEMAEYYRAENLFKAKGRYLAGAKVRTDGEEQ